uniref:Uncharacterized protein n=1 Tax=Arion vulgaris TaxID=1028688 RepID=A0A0B7APH2_9EUPU
MKRPCHVFKSETAATDINASCCQYNVEVGHPLCASNVEVGPACANIVEVGYPACASNVEMGLVCVPLVQKFILRLSLHVPYDESKMLCILLARH